MFGNGSDESSYHRKRIRKYSDKQSHNRIPDRFQIVHDYKIFHNVISRIDIRLSGTGSLVA